jgi:hypothetical protein
MKNRFLVFSLIARFAATCCKKKESTETSTLDNKTLLNEIFNAGMTGYSQAQMQSLTSPSTSIRMEPAVMSAEPSADSRSIARSERTGEFVNL